MGRVSNPRQSLRAIASLSCLVRLQYAGGVRRRKNATRAYPRQDGISPLFDGAYSFPICSLWISPRNNRNDFSLSAAPRKSLIIRD
jgi:hypothetical protein